MPDVPGPLKAGVRRMGLCAVNRRVVVTAFRPPDQSTPTGKATLQKLSKTERNEWYARVFAARQPSPPHPDWPRRGWSSGGSFGSTLPAVRLAKAHADAAASRDNVWLALLGLGTDLLYDARGRTHELARPVTRRALYRLIVVRAEPPRPGTG